MIKFLTILMVFLLLATTAVLYSTKNKLNAELVEAAPSVVQTEAPAPENTSETAQGGTATPETISPAEMAKIGGSFTLTNQDGAAVTDADFHGKVMLVFFGFTHCGDVCPATAASFSKILGVLGENASNVAPIFISVDPARDTPEVLKKYLANFDPRIIGLTGTDEQLKQVASAYKAYFSVNKKDDADENYEVDHSSFIYVMDKNGVYSKHFSYDAPANEIANTVLELLK